MERGQIFKNEIGEPADQKYKTVIFIQHMPQEETARIRERG